MLDHVPAGGDSAANLNLKRLVYVRLLAIVGEMVMVAVAVLGLAMQLPVLLLSLGIGLHVLVNLFAWWQVRSGRVVAAKEVLLQLCLDVLVLTGLLYLTGGASNPFVSLLLLPLVVAATILPQRHVWGMAVFVMAAYGFLMLDYQAMSHMGTRVGEDFNWHVTGMWFGFLLAVAMIVFFVLRMAESLRERDRVLAAARESALRDEQLVALGTLAAGAAHELGTPLSTMAVLTQELEEEYGQDQDLQQRLVILRQQVVRCKDTLAMISVSSGQLRAEGGGRIALDQFLQAVVADWRSMRPGAVLEFEVRGEQPAPLIISEKGLSQALITFLDNAADSSPDSVEMHCHWQASQLQIEIADRGDGMADEYLRQVGKVPFTTKADGHGLGLLLAHAIIQRLDGEIEVSARSGGGTCVKLNLDLKRLLLND
ncbi:MAG TPA: HAMP domain-containing histidine kinase [Candidatus Tenderia electrophaga]|uniref:histidine kinase n=1 Tax=Candidatus Tenderia electrophaga TaxID=1748243 RepID=A0A832J824_9GAMM|nr:HAMP domain-containing histidine kinase [Candidatus Tenderia electrophaga]